MKNATPRLNIKPLHLLTGAILINLLPATGFAAAANPLSGLPDLAVNSAYVAAGGILFFAVLILALVLGRKTRLANLGIYDLSTELAHTRERLVEASNLADAKQRELLKTTKHRDETLLEAHVGIFRLELNGTCSYLNSALQDMCGLYPKKALKEGLQSAIHDDDVERFQTAWDAFTSGREPFNLRFRFKRPKGKHVYVQCHANRILNEKKDAAYFMGWVTDVTRFHEEEGQIKAEIRRYEQFVEETHEGYFQLTPAAPISLDAPPEKITEAILTEMRLAGCNETFAAMYGEKPAALAHKAVNELQDGCGPLRNPQAIREFIAAEYKSVNLESIRHDQNGNRLNLLSNVVGLIEDNHLVGIWGSQRNISQQKREKIELSSQVQFLKRILSALPADVYVKDTRCRYLYTSSKLAERTGIPQEEWIGKTTFEVLPGTPRDHDRHAIEIMKSGKIGRRERPYEARGRTGWMETIQIPLVSNEGLVEGVVGLSIETTERRKKEEAVVQQNQQLQQQLTDRTTALEKSRNEHSTTSDSLSESIHQLHLVEAKMANSESEFEKKLTASRVTVETLRNNEDQLITRQKDLEKTLSKQLAQLDNQSNKLKTWEELLTIKEDALRQIEIRERELQQQFATEIKLRKDVDQKLKASRAAESSANYELEMLTGERDSQHEELLSRHQRETTLLTQQHEQTLNGLKQEHDSVFRSEHEQRKGAERKLNRTEKLLQQTQEQLKQAAEEHSAELEKEVAERKASVEKLMRSMEELDELKQQFSIRLETETKSIKQELARKQIREKTMRQHEKELESRITQLENSLDLKTQEYDTQLQAREEAELQCRQTEQQLEQVTKRQAQFVERETQKLNLNVAEIRLNEIKLRKQVGDLHQEKEQLEAALEARNTELIQTAREQKTLINALKKSQAQLKQLSDNHDRMMEEETDALNEQLLKLQQIEAGLRQQEEAKKKQILDLETSLEELKTQLNAEAANRKQAEQSLQELHTRLEDAHEEHRAGAEELVEDLRVQRERFLQNETALNDELQQLQKVVDQLEDSLSATTKERDDAVEQIKETDLFIEKLKMEHQTSMTEQRQSFARQEDEIKQSIQQLNEKHQSDLSVARDKTETVIQLIDTLNVSVADALVPAIQAAETIIPAAPVSEEQKSALQSIPKDCRKVVDMMTYSGELSRLLALDAAPQADTCNLHELIHQLDRQFCDKAELKKLFFAVSFSQHQSSHSVPELVETDTAKLQRALSILLAYAVDKTEKGRLGLHAARKDSAQGMAHIVFDLAFTAKQREDQRLIQLFGENQDSETAQAPETKYGLSVARHYVEQLGGSIRHKLRDGGITVLTIEFPFKEVGSGCSSESDERTAGAA